MTDRERIETMVLRDQAVRASGRSLRCNRYDVAPKWHYIVFGDEGFVFEGEGDTEADALRALLRELGAQPWDFPQELGPTTTLAMLGLDAI